MTAGGGGPFKAASTSAASRLAWSGLAQPAGCRPAPASALATADLQRRQPAAAAGGPRWPAGRPAPGPPNRNEIKKTLADGWLAKSDHPSTESHRKRCRHGDAGFQCIALLSQGTARRQAVATWTNPSFSWRAAWTRTRSDHLLPKPLAWAEPTELKPPAGVHPLCDRDGRCLQSRHLHVQPGLQAKSRIQSSLGLETSRRLALHQKLV